MSQSKTESPKYTELCLALQNGHYESAIILISQETTPVNANISTLANTPLHWAIINFDNVDLVELLINKGASVRAKNKNGQKPIHIAISQNKENIATLLINKSWNRYKDLIPLITMAATHGNENIVKLLVECSIKKNTTVNVINALSLAVEYGHNNVLNYLLNYCKTFGFTNQYILYETIMKNGTIGAKNLLLLQLNGFTIFTHEDENKFQTIYKAVENKNYSIVQYVMKSGFNINVNNKNTGLAPIHVACINKDSKMVQLLLERKANLNIESIKGLAKPHRGRCYFSESSYIGKSPLFIAVDKCDVNTARLLLSNGASLRNEPNILSLAIVNSCKRMVQLLIDYGADVNAITESQITPLIYSITKPIHPSEFFTFKPIQTSYLNRDEIREAIVEILLKAGANPNPGVKGGIHSPLQAAIMEGYAQIVQLLLHYNADVNYFDAEGNTPLHFAANSHLDMLDLILRQKLNINVANNGGITPLHCAAAAINDGALMKLLKSGANIDNVDNNGNTALHLVCQSCDDPKTVQLLLGYDANVNATTNKKETPLHTFLYSNSTEMSKDDIKIIKVLLKNKADSNAADCRGIIPLLYACTYSNSKVIKLLLKYGADPNCSDPTGKTPLHIAVEQDDFNTFEYLLTKGANINKLSDENKTPIDYINDYMTGMDYNRGGYVPVKKRPRTYGIMFNLAKEHVIKLKCATLEVHQNNLNIFYNDDDDDMLSMDCKVENNNSRYRTNSVHKYKFEGPCKKEIEVLKNEKVGSVSWYTYLTKSIHELTKFVKNEQLINALNATNFEKQFPLYGNVMKNRFALAVQKQELLKIAETYYLTSIFYVLPFHCIDQIFRCLDINDLKQFIMAVK